MSPTIQKTFFLFIKKREENGEGEGGGGEPEDVQMITSNPRGFGKLSNAQCFIFTFCMFYYWPSPVNHRPSSRAPMWARRQQAGLTSGIIDEAVYQALAG